MSSFGHERQKGDGDEWSKRDTSSTHETVRNGGFTTVGGYFFFEAGLYVGRVRWVQTSIVSVIVVRNPKSGRKYTFLS